MKSLIINKEINVNDINIKAGEIAEMQPDGSYKTKSDIDEKCDKWLEFSGNYFDSEEEALTVKTKIINEYKKKKS